MPDAPSGSLMELGISPMMSAQFERSVAHHRVYQRNELLKDKDKVELLIVEQPVQLVDASLQLVLLDEMIKAI